MTGTIHQAYFLPWMGYFSKLAWSQTFVILDDVQFRKRFYHDRAQIVDMHGNIMWIGIPVGEKFGIACKDVFLAEAACTERIIKTVSQAYARAYHSDHEMPWLKRVLEMHITTGRCLVDINLGIIEAILAHLDIALPRIVRSSSVPTGMDPTWRLIDICETVGIDEIIIGGGSSQAVHDWRQLAERGINVAMQDFLLHHPIYGQTRRRRLAFRPGLSIVDAIMNVGSAEVRRFLLEPKQAPVPQQESHAND